MALTTLVSGDEISVTPLNSNFQYLDGKITTVNSAVSSNTSSINSLITSVQSLQTPSLRALTGASVTLYDNSEHTIRVTETTTFTLPVVSDGSKFHQMLVLLDMPTVQTLNLGTEHYFNGYAPDMSLSGKYTLIYEYDGSAWVVGAMYKAEEEAEEEE